MLLRSLLVCVAIVECVNETYIISYKENISIAEKGVVRALLQTQLGGPGAANATISGVLDGIREYTVIDGFSGNFSHELAEMLVHHPSIETVESNMPIQELDYKLPIALNNRAQSSRPQSAITTHEAKSNAKGAFQYKGAGILGCANTEYFPPLQFFVEDTERYQPSYEICIDVCQLVMNENGKQGYRYAAAGSNYCFCGDEFLHSDTSNECNSPCMGNPLQECGNNISAVVLGPIDPVDGHGSSDNADVEEHYSEGWGPLHVLGRNFWNEPRDTMPVCKKPYKEVYVYVLDTGVIANHTQLEGRVADVIGFDDCDGIDKQGHGTHVSSLVVGKTTGLAKRAKVISVKVMENDGSAEIVDILTAFEWVLQDFLQHGKPSVINLSFIVPNKSESIDEGVVKLSNYMPVVAAAGNDGSDACNFSPAVVAEVITVGATGQYIYETGSLIVNYIADDSNRGPCVDIFAPGTLQMVAGLDDYEILMKSGTSLATAIVTSVVALLLEQRPNATVPQIKEQLLRLSVPNNIYGDLQSAPNRLLRIDPHRICDLWS